MLDLGEAVIKFKENVLRKQDENDEDKHVLLGYKICGTHFFFQSISLLKHVPFYFVLQATYVENLLKLQAIMGLHDSQGSVATEDSKLATLLLCKAKENNLNKINDTLRKLETFLNIGMGQRWQRTSLEFQTGLSLLRTRHLIR